MRIGFKQLKLLGHIISNQSLAIDISRVGLFRTLPFPTTGKQVMSFLGLTNYFRKFIPNYAKLFGPFETLRHQEQVEPTPQLVDIFNKTTQILAIASILSTPNKNQLYLATYGLGAVLYQFQEEPTKDFHHLPTTWSSNIRYVSLIARSLKPSEKNYPPNHSELLAIIWALQNLHPYVYGVHFIITTDHKPLASLFSFPNLSNFVRRNLETLLTYDFNIMFIPGIDNILPDALSRLYNEDNNLMALAPHEIDHPARQLKKHICSVLDRDLPELDEQKQLLLAAHAAHHGHTSMYRQIYYEKGSYWPTLLQDCKQIAAACLQCIAFNSSRAGYHPLRSKNCKYPFDMVSVDLSGPYTISFILSTISHHTST
jgi:hypothetical protein